MSDIRPNERISEEKKKKDKKWQKEIADSILSRTRFRSTGSKQHLREFYEIYNGYIPYYYYSHLHKMYAPQTENDKNLIPAEIRNFPIIKNAIDKLHGEKISSDFGHEVVLINDDVETKKIQEIQKELKKQSKKKVAREIIKKLMQNPQMNEEEVNNLIQDKHQDMMENWRDKRALRGQRTLNKLKREQNIKYKFDKNFWHLLVSGYEFSYKNVYQDKVYYDIVNPLEIDYEKDPNLEFVEDADWAARRTFMHPSSIRDLFYDDKEIDKILKELEQSSQRNTNLSSSTHYSLAHSTSPGDSNYSFSNNFDRLVEVIHLTWKSLKRIGFLTYIDDDGEWVEEIIEDETYKPDKEKGENVEWKWINQVWEGYVINGDNYVGFRPLPENQQRRSMDNYSECKLPYNGVALSEVNAQNTSLLELGIPYQIQYNIYKYKMELAIAKAKEVIAVLDSNLKPDNWDTTKWLHYLESTGIAWVNFSKLGAEQRQLITQTLDLSVKTLDQYLNVLSHITQEWNQVSGMTPQRQGNISQYQSAQAAQQAIEGSVDATMPIFYKHNKFEEKELDGLIDCAKAAGLYSDTSEYMLNDDGRYYMDIDGIEFAESNYGIFTRDHRAEKEAKQLLKQSAVEQQAPLSQLASILDKTSLTEIKKEINKLEKQNEETQKKQEQLKSSMAREERKWKTEQNHLDRMTKVKQEHIKAENKEEIQRLQNLFGQFSEQMKATQKDKELNAQEPSQDLPEDNTLENQLKLRQQTQKEREHDDRTQIQREQLENQKEYKKSKYNY